MLSQELSQFARTSCFRRTFDFRKMLAKKRRKNEWTTPSMRLDWNIAPTPRFDAQQCPMCSCGDSLQNYVTGGNGVHSGSFWWRTKANEHRNGTHCIAVHLVSWRTNDRPRRQHCKRCHWHPQTVSKLQTTATNVSSSASTWRHVWSCYYTTEIWRVDMSLRGQVIFFIETRFSTQ